jgi:hypothetical protein
VRSPRPSESTYLVTCHIEISRDVTFDEEATLKKSRRCQLEEVCEEEPVIPILNL